MEPTIWQSLWKLRTPIIITLLIGCLIASLHFSHLRATERDQYKDDLTAANKTITNLRAAEKAKDDAVNEVINDERESADENTTLQTQILTAPASADAPMAPVLRNAFDQLRQAESARGPRKHS